MTNATWLHNIHIVKTEYRLTPARKILLEIFKNKSKPLSAKKLSALLSEKSVSVNKTTVYRELEFLEKKGLVKELYINSGKKYYESTKLIHHHHLICSDCGVIEDVILKSDIEVEEKRIESEKNFKINMHSIEFFGLCANCR